MKAIEDLIELAKLRDRDGSLFRAAVAAEADLKKLEEALFPRPELTGTYPVVLFLRSESERDELIRGAQEANPNLKAEAL